MSRSATVESQGVRSMASDRVNELYHGKIYERATQEACRTRIHWMCSQVEGDRVLDIGCSQGIASILLGREGHAVVGVDVDPTVIEFARSELASGPEYVRQRVEFHEVAADRLPFDDESFDTILVGEVLEHQTRPERLLNEVRRLVKPGGKVVITTPFGLHPDPGHVRTFYLTSFTKTVGGLFETCDLFVREKYICFVGRKATDEASDTDVLVDISRLLALSEEAFQQAERRYVERHVTSQERLNDIRKKYTEFATKTQTLTSRVAELERSLSAATERAESSARALAESLDNFTQLIRQADAEFDLALVVRRAEQLSQRIRNGSATPEVIALLPELATELVMHAKGRIQALQEQSDAERGTHLQEMEALRRTHERMLRNRLEEARREYDTAFVEQTRRHEDELKELREQGQQRIERLEQNLRQTKQSALKDERNAHTLQGRVEHLKAELDLRSSEVRYRVGDALVRASVHPGDFVRLPGRMFKLFVEGVHRRRERRRLGTEQGNGNGAVAAPPAKPRSQAGAPAPAATEPPKGEARAPVKAVAAVAPASAAPPKSAATKPKPKSKAAQQPSVETAPDGTLTFTPVTVPDRPPKLAVRAAVIMDEFTFACFRGECQLSPVTPQNWKAVVSGERPDFLFVESAWQGNGGAWRNHLVRPQKITEGPLFELVEWCKAQGIPTVFWNKEDPPNFEQFIHAAALFDHVFTTDENCIATYRERLGHDRVYALPFAAQPTIHNPMGARRRIVGNLCFAGAYYQHRHDERKAELDAVLEPALKRGLHIFDRMHGFTQNDRYRWPSKYERAIQGSLPYPEMISAYKCYRAFLNVNSVGDSPTMFSRRVFELLACGTPVISAYSPGIERLLGRDAVALVENAEQSAQWMDLLLRSPEIGDRMVQLGQRRVFQEHTYEHRLRTILEKLGITVEQPRRRVSVVTCTNRPDKLESIIANYERQAYADKELVLVLNSDAHVLDDVKRRLESVPNARVFQLPEEQTLGACLNKATEESTGEYWSKFDDDNFYGANFITDLMLPFQYAEAAVVGKYTFYAHLGGAGCLALRYPGCEHQYVTLLSGSALIVERRVFDEITFPDKNRGEDTQFLRECVARGFKLYSADRFNYALRRSARLEDHTWQIPEAEFMRHCKVLAYTDDYEKHVVV